MLPPPGSENVLYLMDLSGYVYRSYHALPPLSNSKGEVTHAVMGTVNMIQKVVNDRRPTMLAVAMDSPGPSFRKDIDARYKATRQAAPDDLSSQMVRCEEFAKAYNIPIYRQAKVEADDLIAAVVERATAEGVRVVIVSADKDLMQLVNDHDDSVLLWDSMREKTYGPPEVAAKFGVPPSQLRDLLALTGDTSDNIPGVPSVGPKTASDLLKEFGTIENLYANLASVKAPEAEGGAREARGRRAHVPGARHAQARRRHRVGQGEAPLRRRERGGAAAPLHRARVHAPSRSDERGAAAPHDGTALDHRRQGRRPGRRDGGRRRAHERGAFAGHRAHVFARARRRGARGDPPRARERAACWACTSRP